MHPDYYGMLMFSQAFPPGARLVPVSARRPGPVKVWATEDAAGAPESTLINKDPRREHDVDARSSPTPRPGSTRVAAAPSVRATSGVTLGGQSFGVETTTGTLPARCLTAGLAPARPDLHDDAARRQRCAADPVGSGLPAG